MTGTLTERWHGEPLGTGGAPASSSPPFGQHFDGLEKRGVAAGVSTMASPTANAHTHPHLSVRPNGDRIRVPAEIGIDPRRDSGQMAGLHTHEGAGAIHNEGQAGATLGQLFVIWGVEFSSDRLGPTGRQRAGGRARSNSLTGGTSA